MEYTFSQLNFITERYVFPMYMSTKFLIGYMGHNILGKYILSSGTRKGIPRENSILNKISLVLFHTNAIWNVPGNYGESTRSYGKRRSHSIFMTY